MTFSAFGMGSKSPSGSTPQRASSPQSQQQPLNGQTLYKGMVFGIGPDAHHFDDIWKRPEIQAKLEGPDVEANQSMAAERVIAKIAQMDPAFFDRFARALSSGNHATIDRLLTETKEKTHSAAAVLRREAGQPGDISAGDGGSPTAAGTWLYEETVVAVAVVAVLVIAVTQIDVTPVIANPSSSPLLRDEWVDKLARKNFTTP
ncbi:sporulation delaying protein family toxin [Stigmatella aurantiaca]